MQWRLANRAASAPAGELRRRLFGDALRLLLEAKARVAQEGYVPSAASFIAANRRPPFPKSRSYLVADFVQAGRMVVDLGWGRTVYGGPATALLCYLSSQGKECGW